MDIRKKYSKLLWTINVNKLRSRAVTLHCNRKNIRLKNNARESSYESTDRGLESVKMCFDNKGSYQTLLKRFDMLKVRSSKSLSEVAKRERPGVS